MSPQTGCTREGRLCPVARWGKVVGKAPRGGWVLANEIPARTLSRGNLLNLKTENNFKDYF